MRLLPIPPRPESYPRRAWLRVLYGLGRRRLAERWTQTVLERRYNAPPEVSQHLWFTGAMLPSDLLRSDEETLHVASPWGVLGRVLDAEEITAEDVFVDLGCGAGRVLLEAAARYPFRRLIGVDIVGERLEIARAMLEANRERLRCRSFELVESDVRDYEVPDDVTVAYLFTPLHDESFEAVIGKLVDSAGRNPRRVRFVVFLPPEEDALEQADSLRLVRFGRRRLLRWRALGYLRLYEITPPGGQ